MKIAAFGSPFSHDVSSCFGREPKKFTWSYDNTGDTDIEVYMDNSLLKGFHSKSKNKFLWICESSTVSQPQLELIKNNKDQFQDCYKKIFIHDRRYLNVCENMEFVPCGSNMPWVKLPKLYDKSKWMSLICSGKNFSKGHQYRNYLMEKFKSTTYPIDYFGRHFNPFERKEDVLNDYYFSITIENGKYETYFTEKIMDCFATGTIPVYYGTNDIGDYFNKEGIVILQENMDLSLLTKDYYHSKYEAVKENFEKCMNHQMADDYLYDKIIESI
jgi:hypothetical protein